MALVELERAQAGKGIDGRLNFRQSLGALGDHWLPSSTLLDLCEKLLERNWIERTVILDDLSFVSLEALFECRFRRADVDRLAEQWHGPAIARELEQFAQLHSQPCFTGAALVDQHCVAK